MLPSSMHVTVRRLVWSRISPEHVATRSTTVVDLWPDASWCCSSLYFRGKPAVAPGALAVASSAAPSALLVPELDILILGWVQSITKASFAAPTPSLKEHTSTPSLDCWCIAANGEWADACLGITMDAGITVCAVCAVLLLGVLATAGSFTSTSLRTSLMLTSLLLLLRAPPQLLLPFRVSFGVGAEAGVALAAWPAKLWAWPAELDLT